VDQLKLGSVQPLLLPMVPDVVSVPMLPLLRLVNVPPLARTRLNSFVLSATSELFLRVLF
jgi:hypothetical protein